MTDITAIKLSELHRANEIKKKMLSAKANFDRAERLLSSTENLVTIKIKIRNGRGVFSDEYESVDMPVSDSPEAKKILTAKRNEAWSEYVGYRAELRELGVAV